MRIDGGFFINDFINKNLRQYTIPVYQRNYEWSSEQCEKLFGDIIQAYKQDRHHFTGSVVYEKFREENKIETYLIIDGQQRLTTIYILLKALADNGKNDGEKEAISSVLFNNDVFKRYQIDESSKLKLKPIKSDNQQLLLLMSGKISEMDKSSGIYKNYKTLYTRVFARPENKEHYYDAIVSFLTQLTSKDAIPTDEEFTLALKEKNLYRKNALCKYLLVAIENQGKGKVEIDQLSIEHILPQNKNLPKAWRDMLGEDWEYIQSKYLHTLGNLTLTAYNSEYSDRPFDEKKYMLENPEKPNHIKVLYNDVVDQAVWNEETTAWIFK